MSHRFFSVSFLILLVGCGSSHTADDAGAIDAGPTTGTDAGPISNVDSGIAAQDAGPPSDAGTAPSLDSGSMMGRDGSVGIPCGSETCDAATQQCCTSFGGGPSQQMCIANNVMCDGVPTGCDGPEDCEAGEVCCGTAGGGSAGTSCTPAAECGGLELCHNVGDCSDPGLMCCPAMFIPAIDGYCRAMCFGP